jgi:hypothetical protein
MKMLFTNEDFRDLFMRGLLRDSFPVRHSHIMLHVPFEENPQNVTWLNTEELFKAFSYEQYSTLPISGIDWESIVIGGMLPGWHDYLLNLSCFTFCISLVSVPTHFFFMSLVFYLPFVRFCVFVCLTLSLVRLIVCSRTPTFKIVTHGSKGDVVPLRYVEHKLTRLGFVVEFVESTTPEEGIHMLRNVETGRFYASAHYLADFLNALGCRSTFDDHYVLHPLDSLRLPRGSITYDLTPPIHMLNGYNVHPWWSWLNALTSLQQAATRPDLWIGSFKGYAPRSCDGVTLLRNTTNFGLRKTIVALGSSSEPEPLTLNPVTTWSTNPNSIYQYEPRRNHAEMFRDYEEAYTHGGAGTMATAASCGCVPHSTSNMLDRAYKLTDFYFDHSDVQYDIQIAQALDWDHLLSYLARVALVESPVRAVIVAWYAVISCGTRLLQKTGAMSIWLCRALFTVAAYPTPYSLGFLLYLPVIGPQSLWWPLVAGLLFAYRVNIARYDGGISLRTTLRGFYSALVLSDNRIFWLFFAWFGPLPAVLATYIIENLVAKYSRIGLSYLLAATKVVTHALRSDPDYLELRFHPFSTSWGLLLPLVHVEFVDTKTDRATGVSVVDKRIHTYSGPARSRWALSFTTNIHRTEYERLVCQLRDHDGELYGPTNNCQTRALEVLFRFANWGSHLTLIAVLLLFVGITFFVFGSLGLILGPLLLLLWAVGYDVEVCLRNAAPLLFAAGANQNEFNTLDLLFYLMSPSVDSRHVYEIVSRRAFTYADWIKPPEMTESYIQTLRSTHKICQREGPDFKLTVFNREIIFSGHDSGLYRPDADFGRSVEHPENIHYMIDTFQGETGIETDDSTEIRALYRYIRQRLRNMKFRKEPSIPAIYISAYSEERPTDDVFWARMATHSYGCILVNNAHNDSTAGFVNHLHINDTGRALSCLRLIVADCCSHATILLNATVSDRVQHGLPWLQSKISIDSDDGIYSWSGYGLQQANAGSMALGRDFHFTERDKAILYHKRGIYGTDEAVFIDKKVHIGVPLDNWFFRHLRPEMKFTCNRTVHVLDGLRALGTFDLKVWSLTEVYRALKTLHTPTRTKCGWSWAADRFCLDDGLNITDMTEGMTILARHLSGVDTPLEPFLGELRKNTSFMIRRIQILQQDILNEMSQCRFTAGCAKLAETVDKLLDTFTPEYRSRKVAWAPLLRVDPPTRGHEINLPIVSDPKVVDASFDETLHHYMSTYNTLREKMGLKMPPLTIGEFSRSVNRNPHVDLTLRRRCTEMGARPGIDGIVLASKEIMIASLARYTGSQTVDSLTDYDKFEIANSLFNHSPELYVDAKLAEPTRLANRILKHKNFSAGFPFNQLGSKVRTRSDLRKTGWLKVVNEMATLPYTTGQWWPAVAHAFPKSQVIERSKLVSNPAKLRSVVATSQDRNISKGITNFEINMRHGFMDGPGKVGIPLNGGALSVLWSMMKPYKNLMSIDITAMDSNLNADIFDVELHIRKLGFQDHPAYETIVKHLDCASKTSQAGFILNMIKDDMQIVRDKSTGEARLMWDDISEDTLQSIRETAALTPVIEHAAVPGGVIPKSKGGWTGDSDTTWTNTVALPIILMKIFKEEYGITPDQFLKDCFLANLGDDNVLGMNFDITPEKLIAAGKRIFGIDLRVEARGNEFDQQFLGKKAIPADDVAHEFEIAGLSKPEYAIVHMRDTFLMRFGNFKTEINRRLKTSDGYHLYCMEKCQGYASLTAHQPELYDMVRKTFFEHHAAVPDRVRRLKWFSRKYKLPSYIDIIRNWYKIRNPEIFGHTVALHFEYSLVGRVDGAVSRAVTWCEKVLGHIPSHLFASGEKSTLPLEPTYRSRSYLIERHAYCQYVLNFDCAPTQQSLKLLLNQSPFSALTDIVGFYAGPALTLPTERDTVQPHANEAQNGILLLTAVYYEINHVINLMKNVPFGTAAIGLFNMYTHGLPKVYSTSNYLAYIATAESSLAISQLMPKDIYYNHKRLALWITECIPGMSLSHFLNVSWIFKGCKSIAELAAKVQNFTLGTGSANAFRGTSAHSEWETPVIETIATLNANHGQGVVITAPTATGKTRFFPLLIMNKTIRGKIIDHVLMVFPRNILVEQCDLPDVNRISRGKRSRGEGFTACTAGYLYEVLSNGHTSNIITPSTLILLDEAHESDPNMVGCYRLLSQTHPMVLLSATPRNDMYGNNLSVIKANISRPYHTELRVMTGATPVAAFVQANKEHPGRTLVIEPSTRQAELITNTLAQQGYKVKLVHSGDRFVPDDENTHIIATQVVDAGITIKGLKTVIDTGRSIVNDKGEVKTVHANVATCEQRAGRTGRQCDGIYYLLSHATAEQFVPFPSLSTALEGGQLARDYKIRYAMRRRLDTITGLYFDRFVHLSEDDVDDMTRQSLSVIHQMKLNGLQINAIKTEYSKVLANDVKSNYLYLLDKFETTPSLLPVDAAISAYLNNPFYYLTTQGRKLMTPTMRNGTVGYFVPPRKQWPQDYSKLPRRIFYDLSFEDLITDFTTQTGTKEVDNLSTPPRAITVHADKGMGIGDPLEPYRENPNLSSTVAPGFPALDNSDRRIEEGSNSGINEEGYIQGRFSATDEERRVKGNAPNVS